MATLRILVPASTTNYVKNPAMRFDTTGYAAVGSTISRSLNQARFGIASLKVVTNGVSLNEGVNYRISALQGVGSVITQSVYLRGVGRVRIRLADNLSGKNYISKTVVLSDLRWQRISVSGQCTGGNDVRLYIETNDLSPKARTFYVDGVQAELLPYPTTYCDGEQAGCQWNGVFHNSTSSRRSDTRAGGRWVSLTDDPDLYFTTIGGLGVAPIRNNTQSYADAPGSYYQNAKTMDRVLTILFHTKNKDVRSLVGHASLEKLHALRQTLFEIIKPDKTSGSEEFMMEYQDGVFPVYFRARYDSGMEGEWDVRNQWVNSFPVRFLIVSPYLFNDSGEVASLSFRERQTVNYALRRVNGQWQTMNGGMNAQIYDFEIGKRGEVYAVGAFTRSNNLTTATDPQIYSNFVTYWDGAQWQKLGSGANGVIWGVSVAPNGYVYVTGEFTSIGGVACNRVAYWNGSAWNAMGSGLNGIGYSVKYASDGKVYVGGAFTTAGGIAAYYFAIWNGSSWTNGGLEGGLNNTVYSLVVTQDATQVYLGGAFTDEFGSPATLDLNYVALFEPSNNQFYEVGSGFDAIVRKLALSPSGKLYAGGDFTATGSVSPDTILYIGYFNGVEWYPLGIGANNTVRNLFVLPDETVLAVGDFTRIGSVDVSYVALWNQSTWVGLDVALQAASYAVIADQYGNIYLSQNSTLADFASMTTVENVGTAETHPKLYLKGPCTFRWLENRASKKRIYADLDLLTDEEVIFDFSKGTIISTVRGDLSYAIQAGSDLRSWVLLPGSNPISAFMTTDTGAIMQMSYSPRFWSADSTAILEPA